MKAYFLTSLGLPNTVMKAAFNELMVVIFTLSDDHKLAQEIARSGFVQIFTSFLITGLYLSSVFQVHINIIDYGPEKQNVMF